MAYIRYSNGYILEWDDTLTVGELIRTRFQGYWILTGIEFTTPKPRVESLKGTIFDNYPIEWSHKELYEDVPIFHFAQVLKDDGTKSKAIKKSCHACYCKRFVVGDASAQLASETQMARAKYEAILNYLPSV